MNILEYINKMQEMYGDVVKKPGEVERPQQALDREMFENFNKRNTQADGGRIGFAQGTPQRLSLINNLKSAIAEAKKTKNYNLLKLARRDTGGILSEQTAKFLNQAANDKDYAKSFAKELGISTKEFNSLLDKRATAKQEYKRSASQKSSLKRVNPNKIKMINLINEGVNDTSLLAKKLKISKTKVNEIGNALYKDIYATSSAIGKGATKTTGTGIATFLTDNPKNLNSLLDKMHNVKGLETVEQRQIKKLLGEAFGDGKNPKLFKLYNNKINEYYDLKKKLAGKINLNLDHPLSSQMIKNLKLGKEAKLFVEPLTAEINQGTKSLLDKTYAKAFASKSPDRTAKMKAVVNLAKKIELPLGTTKIISEPFYKQDIPKKIIEAAKTQNRVIKNIKNLPPEEIQKVFKDKRAKLISPDVKPINVKGLTLSLANLAAEIDPDCGRKASASGGRIGFKFGSTTCATKAKNYLSEALQKGIVNESPAKVSLIKKILAGSANFLKQNLSPKELLKMENLIGKPALYGAAAFETGLVADDVLRKRKPLNIAAAESLFGSILNLDANAARAKNLLESNIQLSPAAKEYAENILDYDKYRKLDLSFPSSLIASKMPGSDKYFKMQENLRNKIVNTPETGALDYQSALDESEGAFKAKPKFLDAPDAPEVTPLTNKLAKPPGKRVGPGTAKKEMKIDFSLPTYDRSFTASDDFLNQYLKSIGEKPLKSGEGTLFRMNEPNQRGLYGTQEKFARGGLSGGDTSGPPPESGPNSQGLRSLYNDDMDY